MTNLRTAFASVAVVAAVLLWCGASYAALTGQAGAWAVRADGPQAGPVRLVALLVLVAAIVLAFLPDREKDD